MSGRQQAPLIALFNHKGGVSKTTTTFNLGWALADRGKRVLIVDGDPQCNLTGTVLGFKGVSDFATFYATHPGGNISDSLSPIFLGTGRPLDAAMVTITPHPNLGLLAGNIKLAVNETQVSVALSTATAIPALQNIPGSLCELIRITARRTDADVVLIDMSPSVGALNQCFLMGSDYFIVPTSPDYYCKQAISSLASVLPSWNSAVSAFRSASLQYPFPKRPPQFLGIISQRYRPRSGSPAQSFQNWINIIKETVHKELIPALAPIGMAISEAEFKSSGADDTPYNLINISDFNSLIAQSQKFNKPVFALSNEEIEQAGVILETMSKSRDNFLKSFSSLAETIEAMAGI